MRLVSENEFENTEGDGKHDAAREENAADDGLDGLFVIKIEHRGGESASPDASARNWYAYEEEETDENTVASTFHEFFASFLAFFQNEFADFLERLPDFTRFFCDFGLIISCVLIMVSIV